MNQSRNSCASAGHDTTLLLTYSSSCCFVERLGVGDVSTAPLTCQPWVCCVQMCCKAGLCCWCEGSWWKSCSRHDSNVRVCNAQHHVHLRYETKPHQGVSMMNSACHSSILAQACMLAERCCRCCSAAQNQCGCTCRAWSSRRHQPTCGKCRTAELLPASCRTSSTPV